ncbi:MAG: hypothetical protein HY828_13810 [Actinobacteria bacterium]|nr:hypothetical protein [Actinomycetota bacterium]
MHDQFDHLVLPGADHGLDPEVRARLMTDVRRLVAGDPGVLIADSLRPITHPDHVEVVMAESPESPRSPRWRAIALVVAAVAAVAVLVVALVPRSGADDVESPAGGVESTSTTPAATSPTVASSTTKAPVELTDDDIARATLLSPTEYAPDWSSIGQNSNPIRLDATKAATHAECAGFVDVVFEGPRRPAAVQWAAYTHGPPIDGGSQYVVVFPDEAAAIAMFDAAADPRFVNGCRPAYIGPEVPCCVDASVDMWPNMVGFIPEDGVFAPVGDQSAFVERDFTWLDEKGERIGPETEYLALVRVGRIVIGLETVGVGRDGEVVTSHDSFQNALHNSVVRAQAASSGSPLPDGCLAIAAGYCDET